MSSVERYDRITEELEVWLAEAKPGERFPAFRTLGGLYGVSAGTVFRALTWAQAQGRLEKRTERAGISLRVPGGRWHHSQPRGLRYGQKRRTKRSEALSAQPAAPIIYGFKSIGGRT